MHTAYIATLRTTSREAVKETLWRWNPPLPKAKGRPEGALAEHKTAAILEFTPKGLNGFETVWVGPEFKLSVDLRTFKSPLFDVEAEPAVVSTVVRPDQFEFQPNQTVSTWKCLTAFFGESTEVTDDAINGLPLDEIFVRAKVSKSTKADGIFRIKIQWILEPGRVRCWDRVSSSFAKTGTLLELPSVMFGCSKEATEKYKIDFTPCLLMEYGAKMNDFAVRMGVHHVVSALAGGSSGCDPQTIEAWCTSESPNPVFADITFRAVELDVTPERQSKRTAQGKTLVARCKERSYSRQPKLTGSSKYEINEELAGSCVSLPDQFSEEDRELIAGVLTASVTNITQKQLLGSRRKIVKLCGRDVFAQPEPDDQLLIAARAAKIGCSYGSTKLLISNYRTLMSLEGRIVEVDSAKLDRFMTGLQNLQRDPFREVQKRRRLPVSLSLLICIKEVLDGLPWSSFAKKSFWSALTMMFWGTLRANEVLCQEPYAYNESQSFFESDIKMDDRGVVQLWLRDTKAGPAAGSVVELHACSSLEMLDPVEALRDYWEERNSRPQVRHLPFFLKDKGGCMTRRAFTVSLREAVASIPGFTKKMALAYSGHSPRSGLPSLVQGKNLDESVMKAFGRWSSSSYLLYMKDQEAQRKGKKAVADACYQLALTVAG